MQYTIENSMKSGEFSGKFGKMYKYSVKLSGVDTAVEINQKPDSPEPKVGDIIEGTIEDTQWGKKFKKTSVGFTGSKNDPNTRKEIIRQNSLTNAVNYVIAKAQLMDKKDGLKFMTGKEVIQVATYFAKYSQGEISVVTESKNIPKEEPNAPNDEPTPPAPTEDEINLDDINF